jgi:hypothetical protein
MAGYAEEWGAALLKLVQHSSLSLGVVIIDDGSEDRSPRPATSTWSTR